MLIRILAISQKMPDWIEAGYQEYRKRLPAKLRLEFIAIVPEKRMHSLNTSQIVEREGQKLLKTHHPNHHLIALDIQGEMWSTEELAKQLTAWEQTGKNIDLLIGGPDGLAPACLQSADKRWSLSRLTFPHFFIKLLLAEQLYRASSISQSHPYHR